MEQSPGDPIDENQFGPPYSGRKRYYSDTPEARRADRQANPEKYKKQRESQEEARRLDAAFRYVRFRNQLDEAKNAPCMDCGGWFPPCAMDFDHRDPSEKLFAISQMTGRNPDTVWAEIAKCDLVCANCHRVRTGKRDKENGKSALKGGPWTMDPTVVAAASLNAFGFDIALQHFI